LDDEGERADQALAQFAQHHIRNLFQHADVSQLILRELLDAESERVRTMAEEVHGENFQRLVCLIRRGQEGGLFDPEYDPALVAVTLIGAQVFFFQAREGLGHMPSVTFAHDADGFARSLVDLLLNGLRPR
jgi:TetR/AcrR family transcriptional regulator